jgi:hypothetical protein
MTTRRTAVTDDLVWINAEFIRVFHHPANRRAAVRDAILRSALETVASAIIRRDADHALCGGPFGPINTALRRATHPAAAKKAHEAHAPLLFLPASRLDHMQAQFGSVDLAKHERLAAGQRQRSRFRAGNVRLVGGGRRTAMADQERKRQAQANERCCGGFAHGVIRR